ncbi:MAG: DNA mismatch repair endonuclease MutL, partial [Chlamydiota bacterium]|nr:DNA mismatch repair endonuclease MutL [Chlamydiota bacterium]
MSPPPILPLPALAIDQIAAGEVVESPAAILKELIENSCDAGSDELIIEIEGGGLDRICISDNGHGIPIEELPLAIQRHATSKVRCAEGILSLSSMGFRGEALASIGSVAHMTITSSTGERGGKISVKGGKESRAMPCSRQRGTTIDVTAIFDPVPARKAFLPSK